FRCAYLSRYTSNPLLRPGKPKNKLLASNEEAKYLFYPGRSGMVSNFEMVLISRGNPSLNDFKLITIAF
ncbi:MAG: hypothetical protein AAFV07_11215, partial [Bacteroidota bacterium]